MKRIGKKLLAVGLALSVLMLNPGAEAQAAEHAQGCFASATKIVCVGPMNVTGSSHTYYSAEEGMTYCNISIHYGRHDIYCSNALCNAYISTSTRTCYKLHECDVEIESGLCQY